MWISMDGKGTQCLIKIAENYNRLSRVHERYRIQTTDRRATACSKRERDFTFANKTISGYTALCGKVSRKSAKAMQRCGIEF